MLALTDGTGGPKRSTTVTPRPSRPLSTLITVLKYGLMTLGDVIMLAPFADMILGALRLPAERLIQAPAYWLSDTHWGNFARAFRELPMGRQLFNSVLITIVITLFATGHRRRGGLALAKHHFKGRDFLFKATLRGQMFSFFLFLITVSFILRYLPLIGIKDVLGQSGAGFLNTHSALILPFAVTWYGIFLMHQFFVVLRDELLDVAQLGAANNFRIFAEIALPIW